VELSACFRELINSNQLRLLLRYEFTWEKSVLVSLDFFLEKVVGCFSFERRGVELERVFLCVPFPRGPGEVNEEKSVATE